MHTHPSAHALIALLLAITLVQADEGTVPLERGEYASAADARAAWKPISPASPLVGVGRIAGQPALRLTTNFSTNEDWRAAWDLRGRWDLSSCPSFEFDVLVEGDRPAGMMIYFHSGGGWYACSFGAASGRQTVRLLRRRFQTEEQPAGWARVDTVRLSIHRDGAGDRAVLLRDLHGVLLPASVAVYRNEAGLKQEPGIPQYVESIASALERLDVGYEIISDQEVAAGRLEGKKVAILPLNPVLPNPARLALERFAGGGGKLIACYCLPAPLAPLLGVRDAGAINDQARLEAFIFRLAGGGDPLRVVQQSWLARLLEPGTGTTVRAVWIDRANSPSSEPAVTRNANGFVVGHVLTPADQPAKDRLILEMIGELWPGAWQDLYARRERLLPQAATSDVLRAQARTAADAGDFRTACDRLAEARVQALRAYASSIPAKPNEFRAAWCHSPGGIKGMSWDQTMQALADAGFNAIIPNMLWGASAAYDGGPLPRATDVGRDLLAECLAAAKKRGIAVHVWKVNWNLWWNAPPAFLKELADAGRQQVDAHGKGLDWLCPSHPQNQKLELDALVDLARRYEIAGIHFDYIRYPGSEGCYCPGCRQRFEAVTGKPVTRWPEDVIRGSRKPSYLQFRRDNITRLVEAVSREARLTRPGIQLSAAVFPDWFSARDEIGQDWRLWVEQGYLDFVCPMQYTDSAPYFEGQTQQNVLWADGRAPVMPGIGATLGLEPDGTLEQVLAARRRGAAGFVLFNLERDLLPHLSMLSLGATRKQTGTVTHE